MDFKNEIDIYLRSRFTLICVVSFEEDRILDNIKQVCQNSNRKLFVWDHADYFQSCSEGSEVPSAAKDPISALEAIEKMEGDVVFLLRDFHQCWHGQPRIIRKLRNLAQKLKYTKKTIIITTPVFAIRKQEVNF